MDQSMQISPLQLLIQTTRKMSSPLIQLREHQLEAVAKLRTGSILRGGVGSGKSYTALAYYKEKEWPKDLYVITTAAKRNSGDWQRDCGYYLVSPDRSLSDGGAMATVDSWNNVMKYTNIKDAFFIFDEQRVVGYGTWVKSFLKIAKNNHWILATATPGDTWMDYIPVFIANGFYKNKTDFINQHVIFSYFQKFPKIEGYIAEGKLRRLRDQITIVMPYIPPTVRVNEYFHVDYDKEKFDLVARRRWNPYTNAPIKEVSEYCYTMRKVVNSDITRLNAIGELYCKHRKLIVFYNFDYELEILRQLRGEGVTFGEYNGHIHDPVPLDDRWVYAVNYKAGSEALNIIETDTTVFYSLDYSWRMMTQAAGRTDRMNTPFSRLYYHHLISRSPIDIGIMKALREKGEFNELKFVRELEEGKYGKAEEIEETEGLVKLGDPVPTA